MIDPRPRPGSARNSSNLLRRLATVLALVLFCSTTPALAGWWDSAAEARETTLAEIRRAPEKWRDVPVLIEVAYTSRGERTNPYFTQFSAERWRPITVTGRRVEGAPSIAQSATFERLFVRRGGAADLRLPSLRPGRALLVRATVRDVVAGEPWLEVLSITLDGDPLTAEERTRVKEADRFLSRSNAAAAEKLYRAVLDGRTLPATDRAGLLRKLGVALYDQKRGPDALEAFREALRLAPEHVDTRTRIASIEEILARTPKAPATGEPVREHAGRAAPTPPKPDAPLYLPGGRQRLAPPSGLDSDDDADEPTRTEKTAEKAAPSETQPPVEAETPRREPVRRPATARPPLPAPISGPAGKTEAPKPPVIEKKTADPAQHDDEEEEEDDEDTPPPVPPRPVLSGPK